MAALGGYLSKNIGYETVFYISSMILFFSAVILLLTGRNLGIKTRPQKHIKLMENLKAVFRSKVSIAFILAFLIYLGSPLYAVFCPYMLLSYTLWMR